MMERNSGGLVRKTRGDLWRFHRSDAWVIRGGGRRLNQVCRQIPVGRDRNKGNLIFSCVMVDIKTKYGGANGCDFGTKRA